MQTSQYAGSITEAIDSIRKKLVDISLDIHAHPELNYQEHHASNLISDTLDQHGFIVERGVGAIETAFRATFEGGGGEGPTIALLAEYDALPDIGHGCGHNLIAISNLGAGLGIQSVMSDLPGRLVVLGTPAEEGGGGKIRMIEAGIFNEIDISLSSHPSSNLTTFDTEAALQDT